MSSLRFPFQSRKHQLATLNAAHLPTHTLELAELSRLDDIHFEQGVYLILKTRI
jgi:hypothetical protein